MDKISSSDYISHQHGYANNEQATTCTKLQGLLQILHSYFNMNLNKSSWIPKLAKLMKIERNKTLKKVCIQWISMLSLTRMVLEQYCTILMEMTLDTPIKTKAITNLQILVDVEVTLGLSYIFPLSIILWNSTNYGMFLCVALWLQWKIVKGNYMQYILTLLLLLGPFFSINSIL